LNFLFDRIYSMIWRVPLHIVILEILNSNLFFKCQEILQLIFLNFETRFWRKWWKQILDYNNFYIFYNQSIQRVAFFLLLVRDVQVEAFQTLYTLLIVARWVITMRVFGWFIWFQECDYFYLVSNLRKNKGLHYFSC